MSRNSLLLVVLFTVSFIGFLGHSYLTHPEDAAGVSTVTLNTGPSVQRAGVSAEPAPAMTHSEESSSQVTPLDSVAKWIADAFDDDPRTRAAAIAALATAPRSQVIPVLRRVLSVGESGVDRPLALHSLRILALQQGDVDGGIRDAFRQAIYDGSDEAITPSAQAALDDVENYLDKDAPNPML
jgi:hypothetical protein